MRTLSVIAAGVMSVWLMGCSQPAQNDAQSGSAAAMPDAKTIATLVEQFKLPIEKTVKTLMVHAAEGGLIALLVRGDHELNEVKAENLPQVKAPLTMASEEREDPRVREGLVLSVEVRKLGVLSVEGVVALHEVGHDRAVVLGFDARGAAGLGEVDVFQR